MVRRRCYDQRRLLAALFVAQVIGVPALKANVVGVDVQNFNPVTDGLDFVTVQSSQTLDCCIFNLGLFVNYARDTLPLLGTSGSGTPTGNSHDSVTGGDLNIGVGILKNWDLGLSLPQILSQQVNDNQFHGQFGQTGNTEIRANTKVRVWGKSTYGVALIGSMNFNRLQNNPYAGSGGGPTTNIEVAADTTIAQIRMALNLGYRFRQPGSQLSQFPIQPFRDQIIESVAASYLFSKIDTKLIFEIFASQPAEKVNDDFDRSESSAEALLGLKFDATHNIALHIGGSTRVGDGVSSPDWRVYGGINYAFGPVCGSDDDLKVVHKKRPKKEKEAEPEPEEVVSVGVPIGPPPPKETVILHDVMFAFDSAKDVLPGTKESLRKLAGYLVTPPRYKSVSIEGHTDSVGSDEYNQALSERRSNTIRRYLIDVYKLDPNTIKAVGYGASRPIADNGNYQGRQLNRRVEFKIER